MSTPFRLLLPRALYLEMLDQARAELPNECCGLLAGQRGVSGDPNILPEAHVLRRFPLVNEVRSPVEYLSDPMSMFQAVRAIDREHLDILAVYHSHPTSDPVPSRKDREQSYGADVMNLIISLKYAEPEMRAWWLTASDYSEAICSLVE